EHLVHLVRGEPVAAEREQLVQHRLRVAHRAAGAPRDQLERLVVGLHVLGLYDLAQPFDDARQRDAGEVEALAARQDGQRNLLYVGGRENEFDMFGRLLQGLQQGVEGLGRQHMNFIDNIDLVARAAGAVLDVAADLAPFVNAAVAGAVDLEHVDVIAAGDALADFALAAGRRGRAVDAVERFRQDAGRGRFADAAGAGEEVGVGDAVAFQGVGQGAGDGVLADEVGEGLRPVAPRQDGVAFGGWRGFGGRRGGFLRHCPWPAVSKDRAAAWRRERIFHCTRVHAYGCTFRPDQVHTSP